MTVGVALIVVGASILVFGLPSGLATTLVSSVKVGSAAGRGPLARMADWMIGTGDRKSD